MKIPLEQCLYSFYHGVDDTGDDYSINLDLFEKEMEYLFENGYKIFQMNRDRIYKVLKEGSESNEKGCEFSDPLKMIKIKYTLAKKKKKE